MPNKANRTTDIRYLTYHLTVKKKKKF
jgi:hypothetical protein